MMMHVKCLAQCPGCRAHKVMEMTVTTVSTLFQLSLSQGPPCTSRRPVLMHTCSVTSPPCCSPVSAAQECPEESNRHAPACSHEHIAPVTHLSMTHSPTGLFLPLQNLRCTPIILPESDLSAILSLIQSFQFL